MGEWENGTWMQGQIGVKEPTEARSGLFDRSVEPGVRDSASLSSLVSQQVSRSLIICDNATRWWKKH